MQLSSSFRFLSWRLPGGKRNAASRWGQSIAIASSFGVLLASGATAAAAPQQTPASVSGPSRTADVAALLEKAEQGDARAQYDLGGAYDKGQGVPRDDVEALKWRTIAVVRAAPDMKKRYAESRDELTQRMMPQQVADAQKRASDWLAAFGKRQK